MKKWLFIIAFLSVHFANAQKFYDATVIKKSGDTVKGSIVLFTNAMDGLIGIKEASYYGEEINLVIEKGKIGERLKPKHVKELFITYPLNGRVVHWINNDNSMMMVFNDGKKIKWYKYYDYMYNGTLVQQDYFVNTNGATYKLNRLNFRKGLLALTADKPELSEEIKKLDFNQTLIYLVIQQYNEL